MTEQNGGGCGLFDYDADGHLDLFFANGSNHAHPGDDARHALYRASDLASGHLRYVNVAQAARCAATGYGMGCAMGDFNNDGFTDLFLAQFGRPRFWQNQGDGTFVELAWDAEASPQLWGTSAAFADLNSDGHLDLYVANYVDYAFSDPPCFTQQTPPVQISCGPIGRQGQPDSLYMNLGDGQFANVSESSGIGSITGKSLGLSIADFDGDDRLDIYVACDTTENLLFRNTGPMQFEQPAVSWGVAVGENGMARSGMGVACGDYNLDGHFDLFVTNFQNEPYDLYENLGLGGFRPVNTEKGLDAITRPGLGFGVVWADFDLDQYPDLFVANGHVWDLTSLGLNYEFAMRPYLLRNQEGERFADHSRLGGDYFTQAWVGRSAATGDLDNDGDADLVVAHLLKPYAILRNDSDRAGDSLRLRLIGVQTARQPLGARIDVIIEGRRLTLRCPAGDSFQAAHDPRVLIPVGVSKRIDQLTVHWPGGQPETWQNLPVQPELILIEGGSINASR